jgi:MFS family permease
VVDREKRRLLAPLLLAIFMRALPLTMFGPLLAGIAHSLGAGLAEIGWIVATYATGSLVAQPVMGRLSDIRGRKRVLIACILLFGLGSTICALSTTLWLLVAGRIVQALGAGGIQPVVTAIVADRFTPAERGSVLGAVYGMYGLGTMAGALAGGAIVSGALWLGANANLGAGPARELASFPWHLVFWVNVALAAITLAAASGITTDQDMQTIEGRNGFDYPGIILVGAFTASLMIAATTSGASAIAGIAGASLSLLFLCIWEPRAKSPLFDPSLFRGRGPALLYGIALAFGLPSFTLTIYSATYLIAAFGVDEAQSGLALFGLAAAYIAGAIMGGRATRRTAAKIPLSIGLICTGIGLVVLAAFDSLPAAVAGMIAGGLGLGVASAPPNTLLLEYVTAAETGGASGLALMLATSGSITAPALISALLHYGNSTAEVEFREAFVVGATLCALCAAVSAALPPPRREVG